MLRKVRYPNSQKCISCVVLWWFAVLLVKRPLTDLILFPTFCLHHSAQLKVFIEGLFHLDNDIPQFKEHLRDFLVQIKVQFVNKLFVPLCVCVCIC